MTCLLQKIIKKHNLRSDWHLKKEDESNETYITANVIKVLGSSLCLLTTSTGPCRVTTGKKKQQPVVRVTILVCRPVQVWRKHVFTVSLPHYPSLHSERYANRTITYLEPFFFCIWRQQKVEHGGNTSKLAQSGGSWFESQHKNDGLLWMRSLVKFLRPSGKIPRKVSWSRVVIISFQIRSNSLLIHRPTTRRPYFRYKIVVKWRWQTQTKTTFCKSSES
jgi:hypothetical protein